MDYQKRLYQFIENLNAIADLAYIPFSANLTYLTGIPRPIPDYGTVIHPGDWLEGLWMVPGQDPLLILTRMTAEFGSSLDCPVSLRVLGDFEDPHLLLGEILTEFKLPDAPTIAVDDRSRAETLVYLQRILPGVSFISATGVIRLQLVIKDGEEITRMRKAGSITEEAFSSLLPLLKFGMTELEVITELDFQLKRHGASGTSFTSSLYTVGPQHALNFNNQQTWHRRLVAPVSILFDFGAVFEGYCYDYGRTVLFGEPDSHILRVHEYVMAAQSAGIGSLQAGIFTSNADHAARSVIEEAGLGEYFRHRLGHGIGLDVHEPPFLTAGDETVLQTGMFFTVEPSILFDTKCSARVEDVVMVSDQGGMPLTTGYQDLIVVE